jgi:hypothetical protein
MTSNNIQVVPDRKPVLPDNLHERAIEIANEAMAKFPANSAAYLEAINIAAIESAIGDKPAGRQVIPMNSGTKLIKPDGKTHPISSRWMRTGMKPTRMFVSGHRPAMNNLALAPIEPPARRSLRRRIWDALLGRLSEEAKQLGFLAERIAALAERIVQFDERVNRPGAADWSIHDIIIAGRSQFAQMGALPGDMFANDSIDSFIRFEDIKVGCDVVFMVEYIGPIADGVAFYGSLIGDAIPEYEGRDVPVPAKK